MKDDRFTNLEKDIIRTVGRVLSSQEISELKNTIFHAVDQLERATQKTAQKMQDKTSSWNKNTSQQSYPNYQPYQQTNYKAATSGRQYSNQPQTYHYAQNLPSTYSKLKIKGQTTSALCLALSILGIVAGTSTLLLGSIASLVLSGTITAASLLACGVVTAASIVSTVISGKSVSKFSRFKKYLKALGPQPMYTAKEIAEKSSFREEQVSADLPKLIAAVNFPYAKLDDQNSCLILEKETYQQYLDLKANRKKLEQEESERQARIAADPNAAAVEEMKSTGLDYIHKIRLVNDALPEENISNKLDQLELVCRKIFNYVEGHPNKLPQIRKLMSYYLPMTLKLVERYEQLESHRLQSTAIEESKAEIHSALDKINLAFENLFHRLLEDERMDLSADISVLETMLAQEGLTDHPNNMNFK